MTIDLARAAHTQGSPPTVNRQLSPARRSGTLRAVKDDPTGFVEHDSRHSSTALEEWEFPYATVLDCVEAVRYARNVGIKAIARRTPVLAADLRNKLAAIPQVRTLDHGPELGALVTFAVEGWQPQPFKAALDHQKINSALSFREFAQFDFGNKDIDWCLRLSPHYYNTEDEINHAVTAVAELAAGRASQT